TCASKPTSATSSSMASKSPWSAMRRPAPRTKKATVTARRSSTSGLWPTPCGRPVRRWSTCARRLRHVQWPVHESYVKGDRNVRHEESDENEKTGRAGARCLQGLHGLRRGGIQRRRDPAQVQGADGGRRRAHDAVPLLHRDPLQEGAKGGCNRAGTGRNDADRRGPAGRRCDKTRHTYAGINGTCGPRITVPPAP